MKAVILAAGKGTRMRELTNELPKPMLRYQGKPILEHIVAGILAKSRRGELHEPLNFPEEVGLAELAPPKMEINPSPPRSAGRGC